MVGRILPLAGVAVALALVTAPTAAQHAPAMHAVMGASVTWSPIEVPGFLSGLQIAVLHGDPSVPDQPYALRLMFPDGYKFPPHWHPKAENVTVLEGTMMLAMGRVFDQTKLVTYNVGDYLYIRGENPHFGAVKGRTVLQLHGTGPFDIVVVEGQGMSSR